MRGRKATEPTGLAALPDCPSDRSPVAEQHGERDRRKDLTDMFTKLHARLGDREEGFTLIELMVVVLIIAILIAIAIPTFLGARKRAQDRQAQSNIRNALLAEKTY